MSAPERLTRSSFSPGLLPMVAPHALTVLPGRVWSDAEWDRIQLGYRSRDMDEKWDVFVEGDVVFLHRSWTGYGILEATFAPVEGGGWRIARAVVERDPERYRGADEEFDSVLLELVLSGLVPGGPAALVRERFLELTRRDRRAANAPAGAKEHDAASGVRSEAQLEDGGSRVGPAVST
jgi:hypothetical protein